ncbi:molybdopterin-dependent oxidoreductase [Chloroflexota bacterium]
MVVANTKGVKEEVYETICGMCGTGCGVRAHVKDGKLVKLEGNPGHPVSKGKVCSRAQAAPELVHHPDRITHPMKREGNQWQQITWDEALDTIVSKLKAVKDTYGPETLAICLGHPVLTQGSAVVTFIRRFLDVYGTPSVFSVDSMCWRSELIGQIATYGIYPTNDYANTNCLFILGSNPHESRIMTVKRINDVKERGGKFIVIDPKRTPLAKKADIHAQIRPGSDGALLLAVLNVIISEKLYDEEFIEKWTLGFDQLAEHIKSYPPEWAEKITWVPADTIRDIARLYATTKPACIIASSNTLSETANGTQNYRAVSILQAITGNFGVKGGTVTSSGLHHNQLRLFEMLSSTEPLGIDKYPLFWGMWGRPFGGGEGQSMLLPEAILTGKPYPVTTAIVTASNLAVSLPNSQRVCEALSKLELLVVMEHFMTDTAKLAHIVLPAATCFERNVFFDFYRVLAGVPYIMLNRKLMEVGECWSDLKFYLELAKRMGYEEYFPWKDEEEVIDYIYAPMELSIKGFIEETPQGTYIGRIKYKEYEEKGGFRTPSGKVEIYSETFEKLGYDPLPTYREPPESPVSTPELFKEYPLILMAGIRRFPFLHSRFRNLKKLRKMVPDPEIELNTQTAAQYGLKNGDTAIIASPRGSIKAKVRTTDDIIPGVVAAPHGWEEANINVLTDNTPADPISGYAPLKALLCSVSKA